MSTALFLLLPVLALAQQTARVADEFQTAGGVVKITPIQHASLMIQAGGTVIQVDPVGPEHYSGLPKANLILITHDHRDHMDPAALALVRDSKTVVIGPEAVAEQVAGVTVLRNGESRDFGAWKIEAVPAYNLKRGPGPGQLFHPKGRGNGYVLTYGGKRFYISGDTEGTPEMKALKNIDVAYVCMNLPYTMPPAEAAEAVRAFKPRVAIPYHYRGSDLSVFQKALEGSGVEVRIRDFYR
jgi:L-ascorbate metabolism protein UlaG (beta-lactamase superfamily)